jgi:hypothetical protein
MLDFGHEFDFENTSVIHKSTSARKLDFLEMFYIQSEDSCNQRTDVKNLSVAYCGLLESIATLKKSTGSTKSSSGHTAIGSHECPLNITLLNQS